MKTNITNDTNNTENIVFEHSISLAVPYSSIHIRFESQCVED